VLVHCGFAPFSELYGTFAILIAGLVGSICLESLLTVFQHEKRQEFCLSSIHHYNGQLFVVAASWVDGRM
jgi:uncharacterized membrane protein YeaQ/YmgE (transglycosylase-associated protein family)